MAAWSRVIGQTLERVSARLIGKSSPPRDQIPSHWPVQWWQLGWKEPGAADYRTYPPVAACMSIISQDMSRIPLRHMRTTPKGAEVPVLNKAPARIFRQPNRYQSKADLVLYIMRSVLGDGNAYCWAIRNERFEVAELYPLHPNTVAPHIATNGDIIYSVGGDPTRELASQDEVFWIPQRDMFHLRGPTPVHPLVGESPLVAAVLPTLSGQAINKHTASFFANMGRPSGILRHPGQLKEAAMQRIKKRFQEIVTGERIGDIAVLMENMSWEPLTMTAVDSEIAKMAKLSERQIFQIFRVPSFLGNDMEYATLNNVEEMMRFYLMSTLGAWENLIEERLTLFFNLPPSEHIRFDVDAALLKGDLKSRVEAYARGVQGGVYKPDEVRLRENLPPVPGGDEVYLQQQMVPIADKAAAEEESGAQTDSPVSLSLDTELTPEQLAVFRTQAASKLNGYTARRAA